MTFKDWSTPPAFPLIAKPIPKGFSKIDITPQSIQLNDLSLQYFQILMYQLLDIVIFHHRNKKVKENNK